MTNRAIGAICRNQRPLTLPEDVNVMEACAAMCERHVGAVLVTVMTRNPATMRPDQTAVDALRLMSDGGFRHVPVVEGPRIVGVVSAGDMRGLERARLDEETGLWERI